jgi:outer membrane protein assembly factor BamB
VKRSLVILFTLIGLAAAVFFLRPRMDPQPTDATRAPLTEFRLAWAFDPPTRAAAPVGFDPEQFGALVLVAVALPDKGPACGAVYALDSKTGQPRWTFDADGTLSPTSVGPSGVSPLFVSDGRGGTHRLLALRNADGSVQWELTTADRVTAPPGGGGDLRHTVIPAGDDGVYLVEGQTGKVVWHFTGGHVNTCPSSEGGHIYIATGASEKFPAPALLALNRATGGVEWRVALPGPSVGGALWVGEGIVIAPLVPGLACFDSKSGAQKWLLPEAGPPALEPRLLRLPGPRGTQLLAFVGTGDGFVRAVDVGAGRVVWSATVGSPVVGPPRQAGEYVFTATRDGQLFQLNQRTGAGVGRFDAAGLLGGSPTVLAVAPGPRAVLIAEVDTPAGRSVRVVCLEHVEWFTRR